MAREMFRCKIYQQGKNSNIYACDTKQNVTGLGANDKEGGFVFYL